MVIHHSRKPTMDEKEAADTREEEERLQSPSQCSCDHILSWKHESDPRTVVSEQKRISTTTKFMFNHHSRKPTMDEKEAADTKEEEERLQSPSQSADKPPD
ncbi:hypothetical protein Tco_1180253 [Tanacetum coccineum]